MQFTQEELNEILAKNKKWRNCEEGGKRAVLKNVDLTGADLTNAVFTHTVLEGENLTDAVFKGTVHDYSAFSLWCESLKVEGDTRIAIQLLYQLMRACQLSPYVDDSFKKALFTPELIELANRFHKENQCGEIVCTGAANHE